MLTIYFYISTTHPYIDKLIGFLSTLMPMTHDYYGSIAIKKFNKS